MSEMPARRRRWGATPSEAFDWLSQDRRPIWRYAMSAAIVLTASAVAGILYITFNTTRLSMVFLAGVVIAAATQGARPAYLAAALAFVIYNYFLADPRYQLVLASAEDVIVLAVFLFVAVLTGAMAGRVRDERQKAEARAAAANTLYAASRELSSTGDEANIRQQLARHVAATAIAPAFVLSADAAFGAPEGPAPPAGLVAACTGAGGGPPSAQPLSLGDARWRIRLLRDDAPELGAVAWRIGATKLGAEEHHRLINVLIDLGASAIVRANLVARRSQMEALAKTEQLRHALLSSVSHDFRTPLAAILASATSLRELSDDMDRPTRDDLLATIQEEAERLNRFIANLLQMSRLESGVLQPSDAILDLDEIVDRLVQRLGKGRGEGRLRTAPPARDLLVRADPILIEHALGNVIENALLYSADGRPVCIRTGRDADRVFVDVVDEGPGVAHDQLPRIFEKFFQIAGARREASGAGLGLSIAKGLVEAMHGSITAANRQAAPGLSVRLSFPAGS